MITQSLQFILIGYQKLTLSQIVELICRSQSCSLTWFSSLMSAIFWPRYILTPVLLLTMNMWARNGETIPNSVKTVNVSQAMININIFLMTSIHLSSFVDTYGFVDTVRAAFVSFNHTAFSDPMSIQYRQTSTRHPKTNLHPLFSSLGSVDSKKKGLGDCFACFPEHCWTERWVNKTVATIANLSHLWKPGAMDGIPQFLMNCTFL